MLSTCISVQAARPTWGLTHGPSDLPTTTSHKAQKPWSAV